MQSEAFRHGGDDLESTEGEATMGETRQGSGEARVKGAQISGSGSVIFVEDSLLRLAKRLIEEGQTSAAIVVTHVACEAAVTRCLEVQFSKRGVGDIAESVCPR